MNQFTRLVCNYYRCTSKYLSEVLEKESRKLKMSLSSDSSTNVIFRVQLSFFNFFNFPNISKFHWKIEKILI